MTMTSTRRARRNAAFAATCLAAACFTPLASAAVSRSAQAGAGKVTISVVSLIPGSTKAAQQQFANQVHQFEQTHPSIHVKPVQYQWTGPTFAAKLAAGTLPTVFTVPFTDARTPGSNGQLADIS